MIDKPTTVPTLTFNLALSGQQLRKVRKDASVSLEGHRWVLNTYVKNHAVRKRDVARATGGERGRQQKYLKSGVKGKGRYKTWTPESMLRASFLVPPTFCLSLRGVIWTTYYSFHLHL